MDGVGVAMSEDAAVKRFGECLLSGDAFAAEELLDAFQGPDGTEAVQRVVVATLVELGQQWERAQLSLSDVYLSGRMCHRLMSGRSPHALGSTRPGQPRIGIAVLGDSHVLGKTLVTQVLGSAGYVVADWGASLSVEQIVERAVQDDTEVVLLSVLMLRSALQVPRVRKGLQAAGQDSVIVVGGAPFRLDPGLAAEVGAEHVGFNAADVLPILARIEAAR